jgi:RNA polymerase sigma-70 factor (TIGR02957 family)
VTALAELHDDLRPLMFSIAYRMLGSVAEAEDVVQEAFLRMHRSGPDGLDVGNPEAYATTVTTRLAIDTLRSARVRRERYVGPWLPEPLVSEADPAHRIELDETVSTAFLVLLESLTPVERAVFVLREALGYDYADIASVVDKSEPNCRQIFTRAKKRIDDGRPRFDADHDHRDRLAARFIAAVTEGDVAGLERFLADDVVFTGDGGGRAPAIQKPMVGAVAVTRFLFGLIRQGQRLDVAIEVGEANGQPAMIARSAAGDLLAVMTIDIVDGRVAALHNQLNPDKLGHLGPVGDMYAILRGEA